MTARAIWGECALAGLAVAACTRQLADHARVSLSPGVSISVFQSGQSSRHAWIVDRRWIDVVDGAITIDRVDPSLALAALTIEPLDTSSLVIGACTRDRIDGTSEIVAGTTIHCSVRGRSGRHAVRLQYESSAVSYEARHELIMLEPTRARVTSRFAISGPALGAIGGRAEVVLYDGALGERELPRELVRGTITLDGSTAVLGTAPRDVEARVTRIFNPNAEDGVTPTLPPTRKHREPHMGGKGAVRMWLELAPSALTTGPIDLRISIPDQPVLDARVPHAHVDRRPDRIRIPFGEDRTLVGTRRHVSHDTGVGQSTHEIAFTIANTGEGAREVWIEEDPLIAKAIRLVMPSTAVVANGRIRDRLVVAPGAIERVTIRVAYSL